MSKGSKPTGSETSSLSFGANDLTVGFHGVEGASNAYFQVIGTIEVSPSCYKGQEIVESQSGSDPKTSDGNTTMIIGIVVAIGVLVAIIAALVGYCVYQKKKVSNDKSGVEVVAVTKTRPSTPPKDKKNKDEPVVQVHTDEEDIAGAN